jgi:hypothetical protein
MADWIPLSMRTGMRSLSTRDANATVIWECCCERPEAGRSGSCGPRSHSPEPEHIDAYINLGILLNGLKRAEVAAACYCRVITLRPKHRDAARRHDRAGPCVASSDAARASAASRTSSSRTIGIKSVISATASNNDREASPSSRNSNAP